MEKVKDIWASHKPVVMLVGLAAIVAVAGAFAVYLERKPPEDVSNSDAEFVETDTQKPIVGVANWPTYGQNNARTRYLPTEEVSPPLKVKWRFNGRKLLEYSPILLAGTIYGINNNGEAFAVKTRRGKIRWRKQIAALNASSPAYSNGSLFFANLEPGQVQALRARDGKRWWKRALPGRTESSPVVVDDLVLAGCECGTLFAFNRVTGKTEWEADLGGEIKASPAVSDGVAYVGDYGGNFSAVNISDGSVKWTYSGAGDFYSTAAVAFGRVYVGSKDGSVYSFEKDSGDLAWRKAIGGEVYAGAVAADTPNSDPSVYFGVFGGSSFFALDARTGDERWSADSGGSVIGAASVVGETVYVANLNTTETYGFDVASGEKVWSFKDGAYNPVISDGNLIYLTGKKQIYGLKPVPKKPGSAKKAKKKGAKKK